MKITTRDLVTMALLVALTVLLRKVLLVPLPVGVLSFGGFPIIFAGLLLGPAAGAVVGIASDLLGAVLFPIGPYVPLITLTAALTGALPALAIRLSGKCSQTPFWLLLAAIAVGQFTTKLLIMPYIMHYYFGYPFWFKFGGGLITEIFHVPLYAFLARALLMGQKKSYITPAKKIRLSKG